MRKFDARMISSVSAKWEDLSFVMSLSLPATRTVVALVFCACARVVMRSRTTRTFSLCHQTAIKCSESKAKLALVRCCVWLREKQHRERGGKGAAALWIDSRSDMMNMKRLSAAGKHARRRNKRITSVQRAVSSSSSSSSSTKIRTSSARPLESRAKRSVRVHVPSGDAQSVKAYLASNEARDRLVQVVFSDPSRRAKLPNAAAASTHTNAGASASEYAISLLPMNLLGLTNVVVTCVLRVENSTKGMRLSMRDVAVNNLPLNMDSLTDRLDINLRGELRARPVKGKMSGGAPASLASSSRASVSTSAASSSSSTSAEALLVGDVSLTLQADLPHALAIVPGVQEIVDAVLMRQLMSLETALTSNIVRDYTTWKTNGDANPENSVA